MSEPTNKRSDRLAQLCDVTEHPVCFGFPEREPFVAKFLELLSTEGVVAHAAVPSYFLTERNVAPNYRGDLSKIPKGQCGYQEIFKLQLLLGLPDLHHNKGTLAYCSMSGDAIHLVDQMDQGPSTMLKQAAVIEDLFIW